MFSLAKYLDTLLSSLPPHPIPKDALDKLVETAIADSQQLSSSENRRIQWEYLLRSEVYRLAESEGALSDQPDAAYYQPLCDRLDVVLTFTEHEACDAQFTLSILEELLETQTVASCSHIFTWIERHSDRLTEGMVPQKGKALVLLRTLNELLRRLSKTGNTTTFCGRILTFLSAVFPLGDRSGVNLRGEYGPPWVSVSIGMEQVEEKMDVDEVAPQLDALKEEGDMKVEEEVIEAEKKDDETTVIDKAAREKIEKEKEEKEKKIKFYNTFWSLQRSFARPPIFATEPATFAEFKTAVTDVMPILKEATTKEKLMMGSKVVANALKRKRDATPTPSVDTGDGKYFFAKFLTSPDLIDLEIADTQFRRQFLFQLLILLNHLLLFTAAEKQNWSSSRNRSLQMDFTLQPDDAKWVTDMIASVTDEMRKTIPIARAFVETVQTILEREKNWIRWKNDLCNPFDKAPLPVSIEEETAPTRAKMREPLEEYKHKLGSESLTEIWAMGYRDLYDLENRFNPGDVKDFVSGIEKENARIKLRKQQLEKQAQKMQEARARAAAKSSAPSPAPPSATPAAQITIPTPTPTPAPTPVAPVPQRPPQASASSPPLHPSLPAKPGTQAATPSMPAQPSPAPQVAAPSPQPAPVAVPAVVIRPPEQTDPMIMKAEETKQRLSWLALRLARDEYLHHFGKIGNGDVIALAQEIEKEKERAQRGESMPANPEQASGSDRGGTTPNVTNLPELTTLPQDEDEAPPADLITGENKPNGDIKGDVTKDTLQPTNLVDNSSMTVDS